MLKHLSIQNFQSHKDTDIDFDPKLTVLVGSSNSGKTAIIRAIRWVLTNRPRGGSFIRNGADSTVVHLDDVTREKGRKGGDGRYMIGGEELTALGGEVPQQVKDLFAMTDTNIADQLSQHYLVLDAPGQIARTVNEAVHLEQAEQAVKSADSETRQAKQDAKATKLAVESAESASKALAWVDKVRLRMDDVIALDANLERSRGILASIRQLTGELKAVEGQIDAVRLPVGALTSANGLSDRAEKAIAGRKRRDILDGMVFDIHSANRAVSKLGRPAGLMEKTFVLATRADLAGKDRDRRDAIVRVLSDLRSIENAIPKWPVRQLAAEAEALVDKASKWQAGVRAYNVIYDLQEGLAELEKGRKKVADELDDCKWTERDLMEDLHQCPTCGQELDDTTRKKVLDA